MKRRIEQVSAIGTSLGGGEACTRHRLALGLFAVRGHTEIATQLEDIATSDLRQAVCRCSRGERRQGCRPRGVAELVEADHFSEQQRVPIPADDDSLNWCTKADLPPLVRSDQGSSRTAVVGMTGFEPATLRPNRASWSSSDQASKLALARQNDWGWLWSAVIVFGFHVTGM
jgi:hypothetical protein